MRTCFAATCAFAALSATRRRATPKLSMGESSFCNLVGRILDMQKHRHVMGLRQLVDEDLEAVCADLTAEFGAMAGGRLLVTGGGGFLGYYLVQSVLHWNETRAAAAKIDLTVYDNYARGVPQWLESLRDRP